MKTKINEASTQHNQHKMKILWPRQHMRDERRWTKQLTEWKTTKENRQTRHKDMQSKKSDKRKEGGCMHKQEWGSLAFVPESVYTYVHAKWHCTELHWNGLHHTTLHCYISAPPLPLPLSQILKKVCRPVRRNVSWLDVFIFTNRFSNLFVVLFLYLSSIAAVRTLFLSALNCTTWHYSNLTLWLYYTLQHNTPYSSNPHSFHFVIPAHLNAVSVPAK